MTAAADRIQHTKERKPDVLKKVTDNQGNTFVLQIEFQVAKESEMVYRMAEYYVMLTRKYKLPVQQYVIFLGKSKLKMATELQSINLSFRYNLLEIITNEQIADIAGVPVEFVKKIKRTLTGNK